ncbi:unnamed protein product [Rhizopus stolonifer]
MKVNSSHSYFVGSKYLQEDIPQAPPTPPPHVENIHCFEPSQSTRIFLETSLDQDYLPSSSLKVALWAGKSKQEKYSAEEFPPITVDTMNQLRKESKASGDPNQRLNFVKYLFEVSYYIKPTPPNLERAQKLKTSLEEEAHKILKKLVSHKTACAPAQLFLAECYQRGNHGLKQDQAKAFSLFLQGSKLGHAECTCRVAACYESGQGVKRNQIYAIQFYRKSAALRNPSAMYKLGSIALNAQNHREAVSWLLRATQLADEKNPHALHKLGSLYESSKTPGIIMDLDYARELFSQAALLGYAPSQYKLGWAYEHAQLNCPLDPKRSVAWYLLAAEQGDGGAALALSGWCFTGAKGVLPQRDKEAYFWAKRAADKQMPDAEYAVGYYTELGLGVARNIQEAQSWYLRASNQGDQKATERLKVLLEDEKGSGLQRNKFEDRNFKNSECILM